MNIDIFHRDYAEVKVVESRDGTTHWIKLRRTTRDLTEITIFCRSRAHAEALAAAFNMEKPNA